MTLRITLRLLRYGWRRENIGARICMECADIWEGRETYRDHVLDVQSEKPLAIGNGWLKQKHCYCLRDRESWMLNIIATDCAVDAICCGAVAEELFFDLWIIIRALNVSVRGNEWGRCKSSLWAVCWGRQGLSASVKIWGHPNLCSTLDTVVTAVIDYLITVWVLDQRKECLTAVAFLRGQLHPIPII